MWKKLKNVYNGKTKEKRKKLQLKKKYLAAKEYMQKNLFGELIF